MLTATVVVADVVTVQQSAARAVVRNSTWIVPLFVIFTILLAVRARRRRCQRP